MNEIVRRRLEERYAKIDLFCANANVSCDIKNLQARVWSFISRFVDPLIDCLATRSTLQLVLRAAMRNSERISSPFCRA
jgi:hypothetical protein